MKKKWKISPTILRDEMRWDHDASKPGICWKMIDRKWLNTEWAYSQTWAMNWR